MPADAAKRRALEATRALPDTATIEDAIEQLCFIAKIEGGCGSSEPAMWSVTKSLRAGYEPMAATSEEKRR
jgi:hypothetical protein